MSLPATYEKILITKLTPNFREAAQVVSTQLKPPAKNEILLKVLYVGINASDIVVSAGGWSADGGKTPFDCGLEALGIVAGIGENVTNVHLGQTALYWSLSNRRAYSQYINVVATDVILVPDLKPEYIGLMVSGLTAAIGLEMGAAVKAGDKVLITAAAGGCGHIAVQWAKRVLNAQVIALCSNETKRELLQQLECCDCIINYRTQDVSAILSQKYPDGIDVIWETLGGQLFKTLANHVAPRGRLLSVGTISTYKNPHETSDVNLPRKFYSQGRKLYGFSIVRQQRHFDDYFKKLYTLFVTGQLLVITDFGENTSDGPFESLHGIVRAVEYLHSGENIGKVIAQI
ncbi:Zinc-binding alcohol dehydrogenase domain-containing protein 2-like protein [Leptotrombidium deliense]|uniref:Zinc-binding alcohol dehydrogenase domain-containing protein 2-like protein n=1 Tax=Leptotrombidium deliense TaxID=299467 RepID=A0A443SEV2_9ACAR|nr:Zinc-binding alcohol dehydrogenase domain-containing protein 2-like protein [Leptotrombidium deliense]